MTDISVLIVHYNTPGLLKQTLKGLFAFPSKASCEVIVIDNNPRCRVFEMLASDFPQVRVHVSEQNIGFGRGMNVAMKMARGRYFFVFNPDMVVRGGECDQLLAFMEAHKDVGIVGPKLLCPDGTLQYSCYEFMQPKTVLFRRIPGLDRFRFVKRHIDQYLMRDWAHDHVRDVDYLLGASLFVRRAAAEEVGGFDPAYFVYFEDQDWCRRFWEKGWRVVYEPGCELIHYHRRETARGSFLKQVCNPLTRIQLKSALYYYRKFHGKPNPRIS